MFRALTISARAVPVAASRTSLRALSNSSSCLKDASSSSSSSKDGAGYVQGTNSPAAASQGKKLGEPFPSASLEHLYSKKPEASASSTPSSQSPHSSTSADPPHPLTTEKAQHTGEEGLGESARVRHRESSWGDKEGANFGTGLQDDASIVKNKEGSKLGERNEWPDEEQGKKGNFEAWKDRKH